MKNYVPDFMPEAQSAELKKLLDNQMREFVRQFQGVIALFGGR